MTPSKRWALIVGFILVGCALAGGYWMRQHPGASVVASLTGRTPFGPAPILPKPKPSSKPNPVAAAEPPSSGTPAAELGPEPPSAPNPVDVAEDGAAPHFDVVRVEPRGDTVVAGKSEPNAKVALMASGKVVAEAKADPNGQFVILPPPLKPGSYDLSLRQTPAGKPATESSQSVAVSVPKAGKGPVVVALAEPGKPTKLLSAPPGATAPPVAETGAPPSPESAKAPAANLAIRSVELENGNGFFATGAAAPGTPVHIYLNDSHVADVVAGPDGTWSLRIRKGLTGGHYIVRADAAGAGGRVSQRAEVPFDVPTAMAAAKPAEGKPVESTPATSKLAESKPSAAANPPSTAPAAAPTAGVHPANGPGASPRPSETGGVASAETPKPRPDIVVAAGAKNAKPVEKPTATASVERPAAASTAAPPAAPPAAVPPATAAPQKPAQNVVIDEVETAHVATGDNLWNISRARLGHGKRYTQIYAANADQIRDPNLIYPGQVFVMPGK